MADRLERYREMRDFRITPEPRGRKAAAQAKNLKFYIQRHAARRLHYDFRLELEGVLKSWAVPKGPSLDPHERRMAVQTEDHPMEYGEFEGVIPEKQYGAGEVLLWDKGVWIPRDADPLAAWRKGRLHFTLQGEKLQGDWVLTRIRAEEKQPVWLLIKRDDEEARSGEEADVTALAPQSVKAPPKRAARAARAELPQFVAPMLATLVADPPRTGRWAYEVKHDGYRMLARVSGKEARLFTRTGKDWTARLAHLAEEIRRLKLDETWLDGEVVVLDEQGRSSFQRLQNAFDRGSDAGIVYYVFDAPFLDGRDLRRLPLEERRKRLASVFGKKHPGTMRGTVRLSESIAGEAKEVLEKACELGLEGLIGKELDSLYATGRSKSWIKLKCRRRQDFVIAGYTAPGGSRQGFGALLVGFYDTAGRLHYAGKVGTGFDDALLGSLTQRFAKLKRPDPAFVNAPREKGVQWLRPTLVGEVAFTERTEEGLLRQASFMGLREDIDPRSVREEKPSTIGDGALTQQGHRAKGVRAPSPNEVCGVRITHPERVIWPKLGVTKLELARFLEEIGDWLLPQVKDRPLTMVRCPDGAEGECFYQRHLLMARSPGNLRTVKRERSSKGAYIYASTLDAIVSAVQNGAIEFHTWGATVPDIQHPDRITMDLDPSPEIDWKTLVEATRLTRQLLEGLGLKCFLKTTGGKGLHVVAPIEPGLGWDEVKAFTQSIALMLTRARPDLFLASISKAKRTGKIFVDYLRNSETASAIAAYSPRARPGGGVSTPLAWNELGRKDVRELHTVKTLPKRLSALREDPWADYVKTRQQITPSMIAALEKALKQ